MIDFKRFQRIVVLRIVSCQPRSCVATFRANVHGLTSGVAGSRRMHAAWLAKMSLAQGLVFIDYQCLIVRLDTLGISKVVGFRQAATATRTTFRGVRKHRNP